MTNSNGFKIDIDDFRHRKPISFTKFANHRTGQEQRA
jgi:hypothetical protein